jgi:hypothetical protein
MQPTYLARFRPKCIPIPVFLLNMRDKVSRPYKAKGKIIVVYILILFLDSK